MSEHKELKACMTTPRLEDIGLIARLGAHIEELKRAALRSTVRRDELIDENTGLNDRIDKLKVKCEAYDAALETLGEKGFMSFEDRAAFARRERQRIKEESI